MRAVVTAVAEWDSMLLQAGMAEFFGLFRQSGRK